MKGLISHAQSVPLAFPAHSKTNLHKQDSNVGPSQLRRINSDRRNRVRSVIPLAWPFIQAHVMCNNWNGAVPVLATPSPANASAGRSHGAGRGSLYNVDYMGTLTVLPSIQPAALSSRTCTLDQRSHLQTGETNYQLILDIGYGARPGGTTSLQGHWAAPKDTP